LLFLSCPFRQVFTASDKPLHPSRLELPILWKQGLPPPVLLFRYHSLASSFRFATYVPTSNPPPPLLYTKNGHLLRLFFSFTTSRFTSAYVRFFFKFLKSSSVHTQGIAEEPPSPKNRLSTGVERRAELSILPASHLARTQASPFPQSFPLPLFLAHPFPPPTTRDSPPPHPPGGVYQ